MYVHLNNRVPHDPFSQRMAFFLENEGSKAREVYGRIKKSYEWRSRSYMGPGVKLTEREVQLTISRARRVSLLFTGRDSSQ